MFNKILQGKARPWGVGAAAWLLCPPAQLQYPALSHSWGTDPFPKCCNRTWLDSGCVPVHTGETTPLDRKSVV